MPFESADRFDPIPKVERVTARAGDEVDERAAKPAGHPLVEIARRIELAEVVGLDGVFVRLSTAAMEEGLGAGSATVIADRPAERAGHAGSIDGDEQKRT